MPRTKLSYSFIITNGTPAEVMAVRDEIKELKRALQKQLADDKYEQLSLVAELLGAGDDLDKATAKVKLDAADWRKRTSGLMRMCDDWLGQIKTRLGERGTMAYKYSAVVIENSGRTPQTIAAACNVLLRRGCWISNVVVHGKDLVVIASEPSIPSAATDPVGGASLPPGFERF